MLTLSTGLVSLLDGLDDTDGNGLPHVTDGETTERRVLSVGLNTHGLAGDELDDDGVARLDELGVGLDRLTSSAIDLLEELSELASNVGSVAIENGGVTGTDLTRVVEDDDLSVEGSGLLGGVVLGVGGDVATTDILDGDVLDVEADVVTGETSLELLVVHLDGLDFSGDTSGSEGDDHAGLDDTGLDTTDGHRANTTDLVDILEGETEGLVGGTNGGLDGIDGVEESDTLDDTSLGLLGPALVPWHAKVIRQLHAINRSERIYSLGGGFQHVVTVPAGDGDEGNGLGVVTNLFDEGGRLLNDFVETILRPLHIPISAN